MRCTRLALLWRLRLKRGRSGIIRLAFLRCYEDRLWDALGSELKLSTKLHNLGRWPYLMNLVIRKAAKNAEVSDMICGMMADAVPRKMLTNPLFYLRLLWK